MSDISEWSTKEAENTHLDELTLSGEGGQYINKIMCAVKAKEDEQDARLDVVAGGLFWRGTKATYAELEAVTDPAVGDMYSVTELGGENYAWTGEAWDDLGTSDANVVHKTGAETVAGVKTFSDSPLVPDPSDDSSQQAAPAVWVRDMLRANVEAVTNGRNTIVRDKRGNPHVMAVIPKFLLSDIDATWAASPHPAFIVDGVAKPEILIGKYLASQDANGKVQTLPGKAPWAYVLFDSALAACRELGAGFCLDTNAMWSARALWAYKLHGGSHEYLGNRDSGRDSTKRWLTGVMQSGAYTPGDAGSTTGATLTGSGGLLWNDDETESGIADMTGNVWEWVAGLRLNNGEIQIIPDNNACLATCDMTASSTEWKAVLEDGTLVSPGTEDTLKYDSAYADVSSWGSAGAPSLNTSITNSISVGFNGVSFKDFNVSSGVVAPAILKQLAIFPFDDDLQGYMWTRNSGERLSYRGGCWDRGDKAGPFAMNLYDTRTDSTRKIGFRAAYISQ